MNDNNKSMNGADKSTKLSKDQLNQRTLDYMKKAKDESRKSQGLPPLPTQEQQSKPDNMKEVIFLKKM